MKIQIKEDPNSHKIGVDEVIGLKAEMLKLMKAVQKQIKRNVYWSNVELEESEYKSRDGFIPYSHNNGGIQIIEVIPKCEEYSFGYLEFGECDECGVKQCGYMECASESEGHLDAKLRVWLKFEGVNKETGELDFYLYLGGGNGDAPYFRTHAEKTIFESEFSCKTVKGLIKAAHPHFKKLLKVMGAK